MQKPTKRKSWLKLERDLLIIVAAIFATIVGVNMGVLDYFLSAVQEQYLLASFLAGIFCTSAFTIAPAVIVIAHIGAQNIPPELIAVFAGAGAMLGDAALFIFVRDVFAADLEDFLKAHKMKRFLHFLHMGRYRWFAPVIGAVIIISPLPDEIGLTLLGFTKARLSSVLALTFVLNTIGIYLLVLFAKYTL